MRTKKTFIIFGVRLETINVAPFLKSLKNNDEFETKVYVTAQHREVLNQVLDLDMQVRKLFNILQNIPYLKR